MKNRIPLIVASCLALLSSCVILDDDLSWKELIDSQKEAAEQRLADLQKLIEGLKKNDGPFSLVIAEAPADTVSKGLDFGSTIRVNPSGVAVTKDMLALDYISGKQFYRVDPDKVPGTKASYLKKSDYFYLKEFEADKNASEEVLEGQYKATIGTAAEEAVWDDSNLAFVGAYVDKEGKTQLVSSDPFKTVMMPLPAEGLSPWIYPHASFQIVEKKKTDDGTEYTEPRFGAVYVPLDAVLFKTKDDTDGREYTSENLRDVTFALDEDCTATVKVEYDLKKRYVSFEPDTVGSPAWEAFRDSTGVKRQDVKGTMFLHDRWGGVSTYHLTMSWYNTTTYTINYEATAKEITDGFKVDLSEEVKKLGLSYADMEKCRRVVPIPVHHMAHDLSYEPFDLNNPEKGELVLYDDPVPGKTYTTQELRSIAVGISEIDAMNTPLSVSFRIVLNVTVKADPIENLYGKLQGKWMLSEINEMSAPTDEKIVLSFLSSTKAVSSSARSDYSYVDDKWSPGMNQEVQFDGNMVILTAHPEESVTLINRFYVGTISDASMKGSHQQIVMRDGEVVSTSPLQYQCWNKVTADYSKAILGIWEGRSINDQGEYDDGNVHRWEYKSDGTYVYYRKDSNGQWVDDVNTMSQYFVDGNLLCTRWKNAGNEAEFREWWEIASIENGQMNWTALRLKADGTAYTASFSMNKVQ